MSEKEFAEAVQQLVDDEDVRAKIAAGDFSPFEHLDLDDEQRALLEGGASDFPRWSERHQLQLPRRAGTHSQRPAGRNCEQGQDGRQGLQRDGWLHQGVTITAEPRAYEAITLDAAARHALATLGDAIRRAGTQRLVRRDAARHAHCPRHAGCPPAAPWCRAPRRVRDRGRRGSRTSTSSPRLRCSAACSPPCPSSDGDPTWSTSDRIPRTWSRRSCGSRPAACELRNSRRHRSPHRHPGIALPPRGRDRRRAQRGAGRGDDHGPETVIRRNTRRRCVADVAGGLRPQAFISSPATPLGFRAPRLRPAS